jgi:hypothetical protein
MLGMSASLGFEVRCEWREIIAAASDERVDQRLVGKSAVDYTSPFVHLTATGLACASSPRCLTQACRPSKCREGRSASGAASLDELEPTGTLWAFERWPCALGWSVATRSTAR